MLPISWRRFFAMWVSMAAFMSANGIFRETILKRIVDSDVAAVLSAVLGVLLIGVVTRAGFARVVASTTHALLFASAMLVVLTVVFETALGVLVDRKSSSQLIGHYAIWRGELWPIVLAFLASTPFLWARWRPAVPTRPFAN